MKKPTKEDILKNKAKWIAALKDVIKKYDATIDDGEPYNSTSCALCKVANDLWDCIDHSYCHDCIHMSSFSQGKQCYYQISFKKLRLSYKFRRTYVKKILAKLKNS